LVAFQAKTAMHTNASTTLRAFPLFGVLQYKSFQSPVFDCLLIVGNAYIVFSAVSFV
jgi:hypothetical protein